MSNNNDRAKPRCASNNNGGHSCCNEARKAPHAALRSSEEPKGCLLICLAFQISAMRRVGGTRARRIWAAEATSASPCAPMTCPIAVQEGRANMEREATPVLAGRAEVSQQGSYASASNRSQTLTLS